MTASRRAIAVVAVAVALASASCSGDGGGGGSSALCRAYDRVVAADDPTQVEQGMSTERVRAIARQQIPELRALAAVTSGPIRGRVREELAYRQRFASRLVQRWRPDDGEALWREARSHDSADAAAHPGDPTYQFRFAVEAVVHDELAVDLHEVGTFRSELERRCHGTPELPTGPTSGHSSELVAVLDHDRSALQLFGADGSHQGELALPSEIDGPVRWIESSPDGRRIALLGENVDTTWILDLDSGTVTTIPSAWFDLWWDAGSDELWGVGVVPPDRAWAIGRVGDDGAIDPTTAFRLGTGGDDLVEFFGRRSDGRLLIDNGRRLEVIDPTSGTRRPLGHADGCRDSFAAWSPDGEQFAVTRHCDADRRSGLYVGESATGRTRQVLRCDCLTPRWSVDGRWVAVNADSNPSSPRRVLNGPTDEVTARWSLYVVRPDGSAPGRVTPVGLSRGRWILPRDPSRGGGTSNSGTLIPNTRG